MKTRDLCGGGNTVGSHSGSARGSSELRHLDRLHGRVTGWDQKCGEKCEDKDKCGELWGSVGKTIGGVIGPLACNHWS